MLGPVVAIITEPVRDSAKSCIRAIADSKALYNCTSIQLCTVHYTEDRRKANASVSSNNRRIMRPSADRVNVYANVLALLLFVL